MLTLKNTLRYIRISVIN